METIESLSAQAEKLRTLVLEAQQRLAEVDTLIQLAKKFNLGTGTAPQLIAGPLTTLTEKLAAVSERQPSLRRRIIDGCESILADGKRRLSRELLPELKKLGVEIRGGDPASNLAAYLSREKALFQSDPRAGGWTLVQYAETARPGDVCPSSGLLFNASRTQSAG